MCKKLNSLYLLWFIVLIQSGAIIFLFMTRDKLREIVFHSQTIETQIYELFASNFSILLTVMTILISIFGLAIPLATYFFQRQSLLEESKLFLEKINQNLKQLDDLKKENEFIKNNVQETYLALSQIYINEVQILWVKFFETPKSHTITSYLYYLGLALNYLYRSKDNITFKEIIKSYTKALQQFQNKSINIYEEAIKEFNSNKIYKNQFIKNEQLAEVLGIESLEYKNFTQEYKEIIDLE